MAESGLDRRLSYLAREFVTRTRVLHPRADGTEILTIFAQYMISNHTNLTVLPTTISRSREYEYEKFHFAASSDLLTINEGTGERKIRYVDTSRILFEDLISKPESLRPYDDLLVLVRSTSHQQGLAKIRTMRYRVRQMIGDLEHDDKTWDWVQIVKSRGIILMKRDRFLESQYYQR